MNMTEIEAGQVGEEASSLIVVQANDDQKQVKKQIKHAFSATMSKISLQDAPQRVKNPSLNRLKSMEMNDVTVTLVDDNNNEVGKMTDTSGTFFYAGKDRE